MGEMIRGESAGLRMRSHSVHIESRSLLSVTGVTDVGCFNENEVTLRTDAGAMAIEGAGLHVLKLDLDDGQVVVEGDITGVYYEDEPQKKQGSLLSRLFR